MFVSVPFIENIALISEGIEYTWAEIGNNPISPAGKKDMPMVNVYYVSTLQNGKRVAKGTEKPKSFEDVHRKIVQMYKDMFDDNMKSNYSEHPIQERFKLWIRHVDDAWKQKGNISNNALWWSVTNWTEFADNIFPNYIDLV